MSLLAGKVALVTGGGGGIGRAAALEMAREGAAVLVADLNAPAAAETAQQIAAQGGQADFSVVDIEDGASVAAMVEAVGRRFGRLDLAVNNAGIELEHAFSGVFDELVFDRLIGVNLKGTWQCLRHEIAAMQGHGGAIVNTASVAGLFAAPGLPVYSASKHGVVGITRSLAVEYARRGIRINAVCPAVIRTPMTERVFSSQPGALQRSAAMHPMGRIGEPEEVAAVIVWLLSDRASFVTGAAWTVDGGLSAV